MRKRLLLVLLMFALSIVIFCGCVATKDTVSTEDRTLILATTTSTQNSGLLDAIIPVFEEKTGITCKVVAVGTGKALQMGRDGEADVLLVHAKSSEEKFIEEKHGLKRFDVMYNDFVILGPKSDPIKIKEKAPKNIADGFKLISKGEVKFISRGDDSGTHKKEKKLWQSIDYSPKGDWYIEAGKGMGDVIQMCDEVMGYTMSDRATYLSMQDKIDLEILLEGDDILFNQYGVIAVNPDKNESINKEEAESFIKWLLADDTQSMIGEFGKDKFGQALFVPNAAK